MGKLVSAKEFADRLGISVRTLEDLIVRGKVPPHIKVGRLRRWHPEQVDNWISEQFAHAEDSKARTNCSSAIPHQSAA